jgi:hypothetical protein
MQVLRTIALRYPEAQEGVACAGTVIEKRTITVRKKAFLFMGATDLMLKLGESLPEVAALAAREPSRYKAGKGGWVTLRFSDGKPPPLDVLKRWVDESYRLLAPEQLVAMLPAQGAPVATAAKRAPKKAPKKASGRKTASP